jgi:hypothetical protein
VRQILQQHPRERLHLEVYLHQQLHPFQQNKNVKILEVVMILNDNANNYMKN